MLLICILVFYVATLCSLMGDVITQKNAVRNTIAVRVSNIIHCLHFSLFYFILHTVLTVQFVFIYDSMFCTLLYR